LQLSELAQLQQKLLDDKEQDVTARMSALESAHKCKLAGDVITLQELSL